MDKTDSLAVLESQADTTHSTMKLQANRSTVYITNLFCNFGEQSSSLFSIQLEFTQTSYQ